jgi:uncharacterized protein YkwD
VPRTIVQGLCFLLGFAIALWLAPQHVAAQATADPEAAQLEALVYAQDNGVRAEHHLTVLARRPDLDAVARAHSADMAARGFFAHESPEGRNAVHRLGQARIDGFSLAAENIGSTDRPGPAGEIVTAWLHSPIHRSNLLAPPFNATGIGVARGANGSWIVTQLYLTYPR